jgi:hypothetical protein
MLRVEAYCEILKDVSTAIRFSDSIETNPYITPAACAKRERDPKLQKPPR